MKKDNTPASSTPPKTDTSTDNTPKEKASTPPKEKEKEKDKNNDKKDKEKKEITQGDGKLQVGDVVTFTGGKYYYDSYGSSPTGTRGKGKKAVIHKIASGHKFPISLKPYNNNAGAYGWVKKNQIKGYDTGGYTGEWGDSGRLALLHQKEIVLNQSDTKNLLTAVNIVRDVAHMLNSLNNNVSDRISGYGVGGNPSLVASTKPDKIDQDVHIEANFPNVQNSHEIEDALKNLVNVASQRAFRTTR